MNIERRIGARQGLVAWALTLTAAVLAGCASGPKAHRA